MPNMVEVTKEAFFAALYADPRDIMPSNTAPNHTNWEDKSRRLFGQTFPGWRNPGDAKKYLLVKGNNQ